MKHTTARCALAFFLAAGWPSSAAASQIPWPKVKSQYPYAVQYGVTFTDGSSNAGTLLPCGNEFLLPQGGSFFGASSKRAVFVEQLTIRKDGLLIVRFDGQAVEDASQWGKDVRSTAVIDETGLRTAPKSSCFRVLNTLAEDLQARVVHRDGSTSLRTWRSCEPYVWSDREMASTRRRGNNVARLVVMRGDETLYELERAGFKKLLKARRKEYPHCPWLHMLLVDESGIRALPASEFAAAHANPTRFCATPKGGEAHHGNE